METKKEGESSFDLGEGRFMEVEIFNLYSHMYGGFINTQELF